MNFKKIAITAAAGAIMLGAAVPAFANGDCEWPWWCGSDLDLDIDNDAHVTNNVDTTANTGFNYIGGEYDEVVVDGLIDTGNASALSVVWNDVNTNIVDLCDCLGDFHDVDIDIDNDAHVENNVNTTANTGFNGIGGVVVGGTIDTGNADSAGVVSNFVNTNVVGDAE